MERIHDWHRKSDLIYNVHNFGLILETREIFLSSNLNLPNDDTEIDHTSANQFIRNLRILDNINNKQIVIHSITGGGSWTYGLAIYDAIKNSKSYITVFIYGEASSMSSIIPQAADNRILMPNASVHIHWGDSIIGGNSVKLQAEATWSKKEQNTMLNIYSERCVDGEFFKNRKMTQIQVKSWIRNTINRKQEIFLTKEEAVNKGFVDSIFQTGDLQGYMTHNEE